MGTRLPAINSPSPQIELGAALGKPRSAIQDGAPGDLVDVSPHLDPGRIEQDIDPVAAVRAWLPARPTAITASNRRTGVLAPDDRRLSVDHHHVSCRADCQPGPA